MLQKNTRINDIIPVIGFGTWKISGDECVQSVEHAIDIGYRHIDTAQMYGNEYEVGKGVKYSGVHRNEVFITTKIATDSLAPSAIKKSTLKSIEKLYTDYIDLLLIHWPTPGMDLKACLNSMFELKEEGIIKHVGVSNFNPSLFKEALEFGPVINNQVKLNIHNRQQENLDVANEYHVSITAYTPLERGNIPEDDLLVKIGKKYNKTPSQIILRWLIQLGNVSVIPKAASNLHRIENINIFDFELTGQEITEINQISV